MAILETLEVRIGANADQASQGINNLIGSLSKLSSKVSESTGKLKELASALSSIAQSTRVIGGKALQGMFGGEVSASNLAKTKARAEAISKEANAYVTAAEKVKETQNDWRSNLKFDTPMSTDNGTGGFKPITSEQLAANQAFYRAAVEQAAENKRRNAEILSSWKDRSISKGMTELETAASGAAKATEEVNTQLKEAADEGKPATSVFSSIGESMKSVRDGMSNLFSGVSSFFSRVGRIATTMLIRKAIKLLVAAAKEGTNNMYQYSKGMSGSFASSMDSMSSSLAQLKNAAGTAIAPALSAIIPVLNSISSAAITAFNALSQLFALLSGSSTWTRATAQVSEYAEAVDSAGGGGGGNNESLADFDELNVIASESGGGGGGGGSGIDYSSMFEEVGEFNEKIKAIVQWIEDHMNSILGIATAIGAAILGWKVSQAFTGLLSQLAGLLAAGAVIAITCQLVWLFDQEYFNSGDIGWLIADLLTTALGAFIAGKIVASILGSGWGYVAAGFTFEISALTTIIALLSRTDVSALSEEGIMAALIAGIKAGTGLAIILAGAGQYSIGKSLAAGAGFGIAVFGATIAIKAVCEAIQSGVTEDTIKALALGSLILGAGAAIIGKLATKSWLGGIVYGSASAILTFLAGVGIVAAVDAIKSEDTAETIKAAIISSLALGGAAVLISKMHMGFTWTEAAKFGAGVAVLVASALIAIKAVAEAADSGITESTIMEFLVASAGVGVSAAIFAGVAGVGVGGTVALAAGAALATLTGLFLVAAILQADKTATKWGDVELTSEDVEAFVNQKMFSIDVNAVVNTVNATINDVTTVSTSIGEQLAGIIPLIPVLHLGIDTNNTYETLKTQINGEGGLISKVEELCNAKIDALKITFGTVKAYDSEGKDITADTIIAGIAGWNAVNEEMASIGNELSKYLTKGATDGLDDFEKEYVEELLQKVTAIAKAITTSKIAGDALTELEISLADLSQGSAGKVAEQFGTYQSTLKDAYEKAYKEEIASFNQLAEFYGQTGNKELEEKYRQMADELASGMKTSVEEALREAEAPGRQAIIDWLMGKYGEGSITFQSSTWAELLSSFGFTADGLRHAVQQVLFENGMSWEEINLMDMVKFSGFDLLSEELQKGLIESLEITPETLATITEGLGISAADLIKLKDWSVVQETEKNNLISAMVNGMGSSETFTALKEQFNFNANDIIQFSNWDAFTLKEKLNFLTSLTGAFGNDEALAAAKAAGINIGDLVKQGMESEDTEIQEAAKNWHNLIEGQTSETHIINAEFKDGLLDWLPKELREKIEGINPKVNVAAEILTEIIAKVTVTASGGSVQATNVSHVNAESSRPNFMYATGAYNIPAGDVFIANEAGAELVGSINGKTSVANQGQIIEGIQRGVRDANNEQNGLLRTQNDLLRAILEKETNVRLSASAALGRTVKRSMEMYNQSAGG